SRDHVDGPRWVSDHGFDGAFSHWCGDANSPVIGGGGVYAEVTADELRRLTIVSSGRARCQLWMTKERTP
ncbi:MAG: hypothetical protein NT169_19905, partial [Chloroflexi bacterium]|nr:hypothetical protein [Chloroflexota bacterium]